MKLHTAFAEAYRGAKKYGIAENLVKRVKAPRPRKRELRSMKPDDIRLLIQVPQGTRLEVLSQSRRLRVTGLRRSELLALRWANVDLDKGSVVACEALEDTRQPERIRFKVPKSPSSRRLTPLANDCNALLQAHKVEQDRVRRRAVRYIPTTTSLFQTLTAARGLPIRSRFNSRSSRNWTAFKAIVSTTCAMRSLR
jgi:integrase